MRTALVIIILAVIALIWYNPEMEDFKVFVEERSELILQQEVGEGALGRILSGAGARLAGAYVDRITERHNYLVFSTYEIDLDGAEADEDVWRFVGIGGRFLELERPAALQAE